MADPLRRFVFQRSFRKRTCSHLDQVEVRDPVDPRCLACEEAGSQWVHVRMCLVCGEPGCCDSSRLKHARRHFEETGHPLIRSVEPRENWAWCYMEKAFIEGPEYLA